LVLDFCSLGAQLKGLGQFPFADRHHRGFLALAMALIYFFFGTEMGLALRASGKNKQMARQRHQRQIDDDHRLGDFLGFGRFIRHAICSEESHGLARKMAKG
jgi:hypothetical protein